MTKVTTPLPGTVFTPRGVRILKIAVAIMTVLLLFGVAALFYGVTQQISQLGAAKAPQPAVASAAPPAAAAGPAPYARTLDFGQGKLETVAVSEGIIVLHWRGEANDLVISVDPRSGNELGRIQFPRH